MNATGRKPLKGSSFYQFGTFRLNTEERILTRDGKPIQLTDRAFDLLVYLVRNHGHLLRKDQIILAVWPDAHVGDGNLHTQINTLRTTLQGNYIETVAKHGYHFTGDVTEGLEQESTPAGQQRQLWKFGVAVTVTALVAVPIILYVAFHRKPGTKIATEKPSAALYQRALEYERAGDDEEALATIDQALALDPGYAEACVRAAYLAYELEYAPKAIGYLNGCKATAAQGGAIGLKAQALTRLLSDDSIGAMELYQLLIDKYPGDADALYRFAEVATDLDRIQEAEKATGECLAVDHENPYCHFQLMYIKIKQNKFDDVLNNYKSLPANILDYPWFDEPVGVALFGNGQLDLATEAFERLSKRQPKLHGSSHFTTGKEWVADVLLYRGRIAEATRRIEQMMETTDNASARGGYLVYLAQIYALLGDTQNAKKYAKETASVPGEPGDLTAAAVVLASVGDVSGTEQLLKARSQATAAGVSPANDHFIRGLLAAAKENMTVALEELRLARDLKPRDEQVAYWLGMASIRAGDYGSALAALQVVEGLKGTVLLDGVPLMLPLTSYRIAQCYERLGNANAARPYYAETTGAWSSADDLLRAKFPIPRSE